MAGGGGGILIGQTTKPLPKTQAQLDMEADAAHAQAYPQPQTAVPAAPTSSMSVGSSLSTSGGGAVPPSAAPLTDVAQGEPAKTGGAIQGGDAFSGLMAASDPFKYLGTQSNQLRPLGQRLGVQDSMALAGLQRRVY